MDIFPKDHSLWTRGLERVDGASVASIAKGVDIALFIFWVRGYFLSARFSFIDDDHHLLPLNGAS